VDANDLEILNGVLDTTHPTKERVIADIGRASRKTEAAIRIFEADESLIMPDYIAEAVSAW
jgi:hypothetical protein